MCVSLNFYCRHARVRACTHLNRHAHTASAFALCNLQVHQTTYAAMENAKARIDNVRKMCMFAGINAIPTREELMQSLVTMNIMQCVTLCSFPLLASFHPIFSFSHCR